ncbi:MAG: hypothetical protein KDA92_19815, partial [Planctomycetales bacterium]|nr:hypothetical protein [Planctomycetales bacterium]
MLRSIRGQSYFLQAMVVAFAGLLCAESWAQRNFTPPVESPEVSADRMVTFRVRATGAEGVRLGGGDLPQVGQGLDMKDVGDGVWEIAVGPVDPGAYRYRFDLAGVPVSDPVNPTTSESNGNSWSLVHVPGAAWMDEQQVGHGAVAEVHYFSKSLQRARRMHIYTPPGYDGNDAAQYPVFYLLHGAMDCDDSWSTVGRANFIIDNLIANKQAEPMIVVMPAGHTGPFTFGRGGLPMNEFVEDFVNDIKPYIESHYRVHTDRAHTAIAGLSMGGAHTLSIGIPHLNDYAYLGVFSSGVFGIDRQGQNGDGGPTWEEQNKTQLDDPQLKQGLKLVWFATGKDDFLLNTSRATVDTLKKHGFEVTYKETLGGHTWINWREYLAEFTQYLFRDGVTPQVFSSTVATKNTIDGTWTTEFETQIGTQRYQFELATSNGSIQGSAQANIGGDDFKSKITQGKVDGDNVQFIEELEFRGTPLQIEYAGTFSGDELTLTR